MSFSREAKDLNAVLQVVLLNGEGPSGDFDDGAVVEVVGEEGRVDRGRHQDDLEQEKNALKTLREKLGIGYEEKL